MSDGFVSQKKRGKKWNSVENKSTNSAAVWFQVSKGIMTETSVDLILAVKRGIFFKKKQSFKFWKYNQN